jgi:hypothetical protein
MDSEDDESSAPAEPSSAFGSSKLKYTHVLKRGVTKIEHYGLKLASNSSYPAHVVKNASNIASAILENRKVN